MAPQTSTRLTYEDYLELPNDGKRYEIIEGELFVNPSPFTRHQRIVGRFFAALDRYFEQNGGGEAFVAPLDVVLTDDSIVQPDVIVVTAVRSACVGEKNINGAPDIVIEVISDGSRRSDEIVKRKLYERHGINEYWIADPAIDVVKIYRRSGDVFIRAAEISAETGGELTSPLLPGFALDVNVIFDV
jgi:Uma2 family endonuclease